MAACMNVLILRPQRATLEQAWTWQRGYTAAGCYGTCMLFWHRRLFLSVLLPLSKLMTHNEAHTWYA